MESRLKRPRHPMPAFVKNALGQSGMMPAYRARPPYQRNDYIGWISRAALEPTRQKRLAQMLDELRRGNRYMKMRWAPKKAVTAAPAAQSAATLPAPLSAVFRKDIKMKLMWRKLRPSCQKEYARYVADAKKPETVAARVARVLKMTADYSARHPNKRSK